MTLLIPRLRVRSAAGEVPLASFQWAASTDPLDEHTLAAAAAGVSTHRYAHVGPGAGRRDREATSSSAVSRRFVALSTKRLQSFLGRPLGELDLRAVCIDGKVFRDHCMVIELGIDTQGRKHVLGLREGATETAAVTTGLLSDLVTRGLPTDRTLLFLIDGAQGLRRAITDVFGSRGVVQRCQVHVSIRAGVSSPRCFPLFWSDYTGLPATLADKRWLIRHRHRVSRLPSVLPWSVSQIYGINVLAPAADRLRGAVRQAKGGVLGAAELYRVARAPIYTMHLRDSTLDHHHAVSVGWYSSSWAARLRSRTWIPGSQM